MGVIRNFINIEGLAPEGDLIKNENGHTIIYSDNETIIFPEDKTKIKNIYEVMLSVEITTNRSIKTPIGNIIVLDGVKKYKIIYTEESDLDRMSIINHELPFNTFTECPGDFEDIWNIDIHVIDAYFSLIDEKSMYGHYLFLLDIIYDGGSNKSFLKKFDSNSNNSILINGEPLKNMIEELSISKNHEKNYTIDPLLDLDEEIL